MSHVSTGNGLHRPLGITLLATFYGGMAILVLLAIPVIFWMAIADPTAPAGVVPGLLVMLFMAMILAALSWGLWQMSSWTLIVLLFILGGATVRWLHASGSDQAPPFWYFLVTLPQVVYLLLPSVQRAFRGDR